MSKKFVLPESHKSALPQHLAKEIRLHPSVKQVPLSKLTPNPRNNEFFNEESEQYFTNLRTDIEKRGITVPLIAKQNGVLLAGHNRLRVAAELGFATVPVQYIDEGDNGEFALSEEQEREFVVKDNLFRRQLTTEEWIKTYKLLFPDFDAQLAAHGRPKNGETRLTAAQIAEKTGQNPETVRKQLQRYKAQQEGTEKQDSFRFSRAVVKRYGKDIIAAIEENRLKEAVRLAQELTLF